MFNVYFVMIVIANAADTNRSVKVKLFILIYELIFKITSLT